MISATMQGSADGAILNLKKSIVRRYIASDAVSMAKAANNPNVAQSLRNRFPSPYSLADAQSWINFCTTPQESPHYTFAIVHPTTGDVMGSIEITPGEDVHCRTAELGYWIGEEYWGKGIMGEVVVAFVDSVFEDLKVKDKDGNELGLTRIWAHMFAHNQGSEAVVKKAGFVYEGRSRASVWKNGVVMDQLMYALTREDWEKRKLVA
jgi:ribosomal-protein-alanine N-acetyltransferase